MTTIKPKTKRVSKVPVCAACGKKLRKFTPNPSTSNTNNNHLAARSLRHSNPRLTWEEFNALHTKPGAYEALELTCDSKQFCPECQQPVQLRIVKTDDGELLMMAGAQPCGDSMPVPRKRKRSKPRTVRHGRKKGSKR